MKTRLLIIIGIIIVASVTAIFATNFLNDKNFTISDNTPEQLKKILRVCTASHVFVGTVSFSHYNDTHKIDTINCKWIENETSVDTTSHTVDLTLPKKPINATKQIQEIIKHCDTEGERTEILLRYSNDTHMIDNISCKWNKK